MPEQITVSKLLQLFKFQKLVSLDYDKFVDKFWTHLSKIQYKQLNNNVAKLKRRACLKGAN